MLIHNDHNEVGERVKNKISKPIETKKKLNLQTPYIIKLNAELKNSKPIHIIPEAVNPESKIRIPKIDNPTNYKIKNYKNKIRKSKAHNLKTLKL